MTDTPAPAGWATVPRTTVRWSLARVDGDTTDVAVGDKVTLQPTVTGVAVVDPLNTNSVSVILESRTYKIRGDGALVDDQGDMAAVLAVDNPRVATPGGRVVQWIARHERSHGVIRFPAAAGETVELSRWAAATVPKPTQRSWAEQLMDAAEDVTTGLAAAVGAGDAAVTAAGQAVESATSAADSAATATAARDLTLGYRDEARTAAADAEMSADAAGASASAAAGSESAAAGHASTAAGSADSAASSASAAASSADAASSSATTAGGHASDAGDVLTATVEARDLTLGYRDTASGAVTAATEQAGLASTARAGAETARDAATASATEADNDRLAAIAAKNEAITARDGAVAARSGAETAHAEAESAQQGAETARDEATAARTGAESARDEAVDARDLTLGYRDTASGAVTAATEQAGLASTARAGAETARDAATASATEADNDRIAAVEARTGAETARDETVQVASSIAITADATDVAPGTPADVNVTGEAPQYHFGFEVPRGRDAFVASATPPADTSVLWLDTTVPSLPETGSPFELRGYGMPNGVVSAPTGTYYTDVVGTNGAWRWLKTSGTGNTGWEVVHGDTGPIDLRPYMTEYWTAIHASVTRYASHSIIAIHNAVPAQSIVGLGMGSARTMFSDVPKALIPVRVINQAHGSMFSFNGQALTLSITYGSSTASNIRTRGLGQFQAADQYSGTLVIPTNDPWPTTLPGTAV